MDLIDRQEVLDETDKWLNDLLEDDSAKDIRVGIMMVRVYMKQMSAVQPEDCDTCKHGYFGDEQCNSCRVRFTSHYERRTDGEIIPE